MASTLVEGLGHLGVVASVVVAGVAANGASIEDEVGTMEVDVRTISTSPLSTIVGAAHRHGAGTLAEADGLPKEGSTWGFLDIVFFDFGAPSSITTLFLFVTIKASSENFITTKDRIEDLVKIIASKYKENFKNVLSELIGLSFASYMLCFLNRSYYRGTSMFSNLLKSSSLAA